MKRTTPHADFVRGIWKENPVLIQMLGLCPALAVTSTMRNSLAMAAATFFVLMGSSFLVSLLKKWIPNEVRISTYILIIASFVTITDLALEAFAFDVHKALGAFISLIVVNCMILGRQEAFASKRPVGRALLDALGTGIGFAIAMLMIGTVREVLGWGSILRDTPFMVEIPGFEPWVIMVSPPGGFLTLGFLLLGLAWWERRGARRAKPEPAGEESPAGRAA